MLDLNELKKEIYADILYVEEISDKKKEIDLWYSESTLHKISQIKKQRNASIDKKLKLLELCILDKE